jgi:hypothetical protein
VDKKLEKIFQGKVHGKIALVTGASSGIGMTVAKNWLAQVHTYSWSPVLKKNF